MPVSVPRPREAGWTRRRPRPFLRHRRSAARDQALGGGEFTALELPSLRPIGLPTAHFRVVQVKIFPGDSCFSVRQGLKRVVSRSMLWSNVQKFAFFACNIKTLRCPQAALKIKTLISDHLSSHHGVFRKSER